MVRNYIIPVSIIKGNSVFLNSSEKILIFLNGSLLINVVSNIFGLNLNIAYAWSVPFHILEMGMVLLPVDIKVVINPIKVGTWSTIKLGF